ncbi:MAG: potassium-transporting ATPase subunit KdpC [Parachlamydiaceae bacterium]|nr:potassium-transporting ATPase subunit KdpC [Parachlamydiaceae bacterium]
MLTLWQSLRMFLWMTLLTGIIYPLIVTLIAQVTMPQNANGSLVIQNDKIIGSSLIAQNFESNRYFWPRPSAVNHNPLPSGGSNLSPTSLKLKQQVESRKERLNGSSPIPIPSELLFASGSGLDPHISMETAYFQIERILKERANYTVETLKTLIDDNIEGYFGIYYVNVLHLNLLLDRNSP